MLSDLGLGPKFFGITKFRNYYALVTQEIPGIHLRPTELKMLLKNLSLIDESSLKSLEQIMEFIEKEKIHPFDMQMRLGKDKKFYIIDPTYLTKSKVPEDPLRNQVLEDLRQLAAFVKAASNAKIKPSPASLLLVDKIGSVEKKFVLPLLQFLEENPNLPPDKVETTLLEIFEKTPGFSGGARELQKDSQYVAALEKWEKLMKEVEHPASESISGLLATADPKGELRRKKPCPKLFNIFGRR